MHRIDAPDRLCSSRYPAKNSAPFCGPMVAQTPPPKAIAPITDAAALSARNSISGSATCMLRRNVLARPLECHMCSSLARTLPDSMQHGWTLFVQQPVRLCITPTAGTHLHPVQAA